MQTSMQGRDRPPLGSVEMRNAGGELPGGDFPAPPKDMGEEEKQPHGEEGRPRRSHLLSGAMAPSIVHGHVVNFGRGHSGVSRLPTSEIFEQTSDDAPVAVVAGHNQSQCFGVSKKRVALTTCFCTVAASVILGVLLSLKPSKTSLPNINSTQTGSSLYDDGAGMRIPADFSFSPITQVASRPTVTPPPPPALTTTPPPATTTSPPPSLAPAPAKPAAPPPLPLRQYRFLPYWECVNRLLDLQRQYPELVEVYTTQDKYALPVAGKCFVTSGSSKSDCKVYVLNIVNKKLKNANTPTVLLSGTVHGNERVGPTAVTEFGTWLLEQYSRDPWVQLLVDTRNIIIVPAANAMGYAENTREEKGIDPNRDFAWDVASPADCMQTIAARSINELWREHIVQLGATFHGGDHLIAYPWGDFIHCPPGNYGCKRTPGDERTDYMSPDNSGMKSMVDGMREYIGALAGAKYLTGILNDPQVIYAVNGGMEDWSYGASWLDSGKVRCRPSTFGGYSEEKTVYNDATHRGINLLVETAREKAPPDSQAGGSDAVVAGAGGGHRNDGHVSRNMRLCLYLTDIVEPWVRFDGASSLPSSLPRSARTTLSFLVGGVVHLDEARVVCVDSAGGSGCDGRAVLNKAIWGEGDRKSGPYQLDFTISPTAALGAMTVRVEIKADQAWAEPSRPEAVPYNGRQPQTHFVRARTDATWQKTNTESAKVQGRIWWSSPTQTLIVTANRRVLPPPGHITKTSETVNSRVTSKTLNSPSQSLSKSRQDVVQDRDGMGGNIPDTLAHTIYDQDVLRKRMAVKNTPR